MKVPPVYQITPEILEYVAKIDANIIFFSSVQVPKIFKDKVQRISLLKSSLFSARIEGNPLTLDEVESTDNQVKKKEIFNILKAIEFLNKGYPLKKNLDKKLIRALHKIVMDGLMAGPGRLRREMGAIFNESGYAVYISPPPQKIPELLEKFINYTGNKDERFPLISALMSHLLFEKIHPFIDGNGRVGRLLVFAVLKSKGYEFDFFIPFEEYLDEHKSDYYYFLDVGLKEPERYLVFMLKAFYSQTEKIKSTLMDYLMKKDNYLLPLRQEEIYSIIKDHQTVSFDFVKRRFLKIPERTLRYDLKKLQDKKIIIKIGKTKGCYYRIRD
jgi:Fic family protein